jgi:hypothetical protein
MKFRERMTILSEGESATETYKGDRTMEAHETDNIIGILEDDGCVKCKACMNEKDWEILTQENTITPKKLESDERLLYCDYCEARLNDRPGKR